MRDSRTIIVTGEDCALMTSVLRQFLAAGDHVAILATGSLSDKITSLGDSSRLFSHERVDLSSYKVCEQAMLRVVAKWRAIDVVINIGLPPETPASTFMTTNKMLESMYSETTLRMINATRAGLVPLCWRADGRIINCTALPSSVEPGTADIFQRGIIDFTETLAEEIKPSGVTANVVVLQMPANTRKHSLPKVVSEEAIADAIFFLASHAARGVTGSTLRL